MDGNPPIINIRPPMTMMTPASKKVKLLMAINIKIGCQIPTMRNITRLMTRITPKQIVAHTIVEITFCLSNAVHVCENGYLLFLIVAKAFLKVPLLAYCLICSIWLVYLFESSAIDFLTKSQNSFSNAMN